MSRLNAERRRHPRSAGIIPLKIFKKGLDAITETRNISCTGLHCRTSKFLPLMSKIGLTLLLPISSGRKVRTEKIKCSGVVVRSEPVISKEAETAYQNVAIFFTDITKKDKQKIAQYVMQSFKKDLSSAHSS